MDLFELQSRTVIVTGASSGIGRATAALCAQAGARVLLVGRQASKLAETQAMLEGSSHVAFAYDLSNEANVIELAAKIKALVPTIDGVAHCAGIHWLRPIQLTEQARLDEMLRSHVGSSAALGRALLNAKLFSTNGGSFVMISSAAALQGNAGALAYAAAKGALISMTRVFATELARRKWRVNVVVPGVVETPQSTAMLSMLTEEQRTALANEHLLGLGTASDVASAILFLLSSGAKWITGTTLVVDGGLTAH